MTTTTMNDSLTAGAILEAETYEPIQPQAVTLTEPRSPAAEAYRVLRYRLEILQKGGIKSLAFTSAQGREGRTTVAVNTALALGRGGRNRVALIDADLRQPSVHTMLGLRPREGLCDVVAGRASLSSCLWRFGHDELYVLPAGNVPDDLGTTLYDRRLADTLAELKERFDFVLLDVPPVLRLADVPTLCRDLDGALVVVRAGITPLELVGAAVDALYGVPVHGVVLNDVEPHLLHVGRASFDPSRALPAASEI